MDPLNEDVFPIENGDFPASYVSLPEVPNTRIPYWRWDDRSPQNRDFWPCSLVQTGLR